MADVSFDGVSIEWPTYPVPDWAKILTSKNRFINREAYEGKEAARRSGELRPAWHALWARRAPGLKLGEVRWSGSEPDLPPTNIG